MTKKRETGTHEKIMDWIKVNVPESEMIKIHGSPMARKGEPDLVGTIQGKGVAIEVKEPGKEPTPIQWVRLERWRKAGSVVGVAESVADVRYLLRSAGLRIDER